jgi:hypothetical protein
MTSYEIRQLLKTALSINTSTLSQFRYSARNSGEKYNNVYMKFRNIIIYGNEIPEILSKMQKKEHLKLKSPY